MKWRTRVGSGSRLGSPGSRWHLRRAVLSGCSALLVATLFWLPVDAAAQESGWGAEVSSGKSGSYLGRTSRGGAVSLRLSGRGLKFRLKWFARCDDGGRRFSGMTFNRRPARLHGRNLKVRGAFTDRAADGVRVRYRVTLKAGRHHGRFDGTWRLTVTGPSTTGGTYRCDTGHLSWSTKRRTRTPRHGVHTSPASAVAAASAPQRSAAVSANRFSLRTRTGSAGRRTPGGSGAVTGSVFYTYRSCYRNRATGQTPAGTEAPLRRAKVRLIRASGDSRDFPLDRNGRFIAPLDPSRGYRAFAVLDSPAVSVGPDRTPSTPYLIPLGTLTQSNQRFVIGEGNGSRTPDAASGAAEIFSNLQDAAGVAAATSPVPVPKVHARWRYGSDLKTWLGDSLKEPAYAEPDRIYVYGTLQGRKRAEYERFPLLHEYGHHLLQAVAAPPDSSGGEHNWDLVTPDNPGLSWSEGFASAFAAISDRNPRQSLGCTTTFDYSARPAIARRPMAGLDAPLEPMPPAPDAHLARYNETATAGVVWALADRFGAGDVQAGLTRLLGAFHAFHQTVGGPASLREARDALISSGLEASATEHGELTQVFADQRIGWAVLAYIEETTGGWVEGTTENVYFTVDGPPPYDTRCDPSRPYEEAHNWARLAEGALAYAWQDDCYTGGSGIAMWDQLMIGYPAPDVSPGYANRKFTIRATYTCDWVFEDRCPVSRTFSLGLYHGAAIDPSDDGMWNLEQWDSGHRVDSLSIPRGATVPVAEFDALGRCRSLVDGWSCEDR